MMLSSDCGEIAAHKVLTTSGKVGHVLIELIDGAYSRPPSRVIVDVAWRVSKTRYAFVGQ